MSGSSQIRIKRGAALLLSFAFANDDGSPMTISAMTLTAQVRDPQNNLVAALPLVVSSTPGLVTCEVDDTTQWPIGLLRCDVRLVQGTIPVFSDTFGIQIDRPVTQ